MTGQPTAANAAPQTDPQIDIAQITGRLIEAFDHEPEHQGADRAGAGNTDDEHAAVPPAATSPTTPKASTTRTQTKPTGDAS